MCVLRLHSLLGSNELKVNMLLYSYMVYSFLSGRDKSHLLDHRALEVGVRRRLVLLEHGVLVVVGGRRGLHDSPQDKRGVGQGKDELHYPYVFCRSNND